jgi:beta-xylosidase
VIQVYLHHPVAQVARPVQQLIAASQVELAAGQRARVRFELHADLALLDPGEVELRVGASSADIRAAVCFPLPGPRRNVGFDRVLQPTITLLPPD